MANADETAQALIALFARQGYSRAEQAVLQPADLFLDLSGEDIRRRLFVTQGPEGQELCLRPEYTIPVCRDYLARSPAPGGAPGHAALSYCGPVFRQRPGEAGESPQAGIELLGRDDREAADAEVLALALEAVAMLGLAAPAVTLGDMALIDRLVTALGLAAPVRRRLLRGIASGEGLEALDSGEAGNGKAGLDHAGLLAAIEGQDPMAARAFVEDVLAIAGISRVGGRTAAEIAERFLDRAAQRGGRLASEARAIIARFLAIAGDPDTAALTLRGLASEAGLDLDGVINAFEARIGFMAARGLDVARFHFSARFARSLDYYTGFIFELHHPARPGAKPVGGGGRYDGLLNHLGAEGMVPAVGCSDMARSHQWRSGDVSNAPLVIAVPSKGRLQENAFAFFARAGLDLVQPRGARDYRGTLKGVDGVEVLFLSASEIVAQLASGAAHLGVTGEDLIREDIVDADSVVALLAPLGFGHANVVVAVPQAWIDVRSMADLDDVAADMRARHGHKIRVATKYVNLTRRFFADHGIADYRIVESLGATEGAPASGAAELIVDITTTGTTLAANALKVVEDGTILRSEANLVASLRAPWDAGPRAAVRTILARIAAEEEARTTRLVSARLPQFDAAFFADLSQRFGVRLPYGAPGPGETAVLQCPGAAVFNLVDRLVAMGAACVGVSQHDYLFRAGNGLGDRLMSRIDRPQSG